MGVLLLIMGISFKFSDRPKKIFVGFCLWAEARFCGLSLVAAVQLAVHLVEVVLVIVLPGDALLLVL